MTKRHLKHSLSLCWILINPFIGFLSCLANGKYELPSQGAISEIISRCCIIKLMVQPDPSYVPFSTLNKNWLRSILSISSIFISLNSIFSESNHGFLLKTSSFLRDSIWKLTWNSNSLNSVVMSNNLFLIADYVSLRCILFRIYQLNFITSGTFFRKNMYFNKI